MEPPAKKLIGKLQINPGGIHFEIVIVSVIANRK